MKLAEFEIGLEFFQGTHRFRVTDKGTRTVVAVQVDPVEIHCGDINNPADTVIQFLSKREAIDGGWIKMAPPHGMPEVVMDEHEQRFCVPASRRILFGK